MHVQVFNAVVFIMPLCLPVVDVFIRGATNQCHQRNSIQYSPLKADWSAHFLSERKCVLWQLGGQTDVWWERECDHWIRPVQPDCHSTTTL